MTKKNVKERILEVTGLLFYEQGYRATGINQIINDARVAKASFYHHFPSKEVLCAYYLHEKHLVSHARQKSYIQIGDNSIDRICSLFENIIENAEKSQFRGCAFLNIASEITERDSKIWKEIINHKLKLRNLILDCLCEYSDAENLADKIYIVYEGTNIAVRNFMNIESVTFAREIVRQLLKGRLDHG